MKTLNDKVLEHIQNTGHDYPDTYREFVSMFSDDTDCEDYLRTLRWPNGFICPSCNEPSIPWRQLTKDLFVQIADTKHLFVLELFLTKLEHL
jgi:hypothetical protein